jgi:titin
MGDPSNLAGTGVSTTQIDLTWWDNSSEETSFRVERSPDGSTGWTEIATLGADVESYQDSGLSCGTSYHYRVRGYRSGDGTYTGYSNVEVTATHLCAPTNLSAWATSHSQIAMDWQDNSSDETAFHVERSPNGSTRWTQVATLAANTTSYQSSGLSCSADYYYRVRAYRGDDGQYSSYSSVAGAITHPCPPSDLGASAASYTQIDLAWQDNSPDESDFRVERSADGSTGWTEIASLGANATSYQDGGLSCSTGFYYRVCVYRGSDGHFSDYSNEANGITHTCAPTGLEATASQNTQIDLAWQDNSSDESAFLIERSRDGSTDWTEVASVEADVTSYEDSAPACNADYVYRVRAYRDIDGYYSDYTGPATASSQSCGVYLPLLLGNH